MQTTKDMFGGELAQARTELFAKAQEKGATCPCCDKFVKVYHRKFNSGMALALIWFYRYDEKDPSAWLNFIHHAMKEHDHYPGDYGKLQWWGFIEKHPDDPESDAKSDGLYRITDSGRAFVEGKTLIRSHANEYMSEVQSFDGIYITIEDALGSKFNYAELMKETGKL